MRSVISSARTSEAEATNKRATNKRFIMFLLLAGRVPNPHETLPAVLGTKSTNRLLLRQSVPRKRAYGCAHRGRCVFELQSSFFGSKLTRPPSVKHCLVPP